MHNLLHSIFYLRRYQHLITIAKCACVRIYECLGNQRVNCLEQASTQFHKRHYVVYIDEDFEQ